jgi:hypothetical protein
LTGIKFSFNKTVYLKSFNLTDLITPPSTNRNVDSGSLTFTQGFSSETFNFTNATPDNTVFNFINPFLVSAGSEVTLATSGSLFGSNISGSYRINDLKVDTYEVPGPLPVFGGAVAFRFSRRIRRRISTSAN